MPKPKKNTFKFSIDVELPGTSEQAGPLLVELIDAVMKKAAADFDLDVCILHQNMVDKLIKNMRRAGHTNCAMHCMRDIILDIMHEKRDIDTDIDVEGYKRRSPLH